MEHTEHTGRLLSLAEAARYLHVAPSTVRAMIKRGDFPNPVHSFQRSRGGLRSDATMETVRYWTEAQLDQVETKRPGRPRKN